MYVCMYVCVCVEQGAFVQQSRPMERGLVVGSASHSVKHLHQPRDSPCTRNTGRMRIVVGARRQGLGDLVLARHVALVDEHCLGNDEPRHELSDTKQLDEGDEWANDGVLHDQLHRDEMAGREITTSRQHALAVLAPGLGEPGEMVLEHVRMQQSALLFWIGGERPVPPMTIHRGVVVVEVRIGRARWWCAGGGRLGTRRRHRVTR